MNLQTPEWVDATIRYTITITGVIVVQQDIMPQTAWDQIAASLLSLSTVLYGVFRTRQVEQETKSTKVALQLQKDLNLEMQFERQKRSFDLAAHEVRP